MKALHMRLALRHEGNFWNAYLADPATMDGAILVGSILMVVVASDQELKDRFMAMMQDVVAAAIGGGVDGWLEPTVAPEHEKAGHS